VPWTYTKLIVQNGWVAGIYSQEGDGGGADVVAMLVRISDGRTLRSELPEPWEWSPGIYPAEKEFWGLVTTSPSADASATIVRMPYSAMQVVQDAAP
jgi:hypothetical protein